MLRNTPGQAPAGAPVLLAQGTADTTVPFDVTRRFGEALCKQGIRVTLIDASRHEPHLRCPRQRACGPCLDGRPLPGHAGALRLQQVVVIAGEGVRYSLF